jgi:hypothetical protein
MKAFLITFIIELIITGTFWWKVKDDTSDGDFGIGLLFWAMIVLFVFTDVLWALMIAYKMIK